MCGKDRSIESDFTLAKALIGQGILEEIQPERIREVAPHGAILITCGDRDRISGHLTGCQRIVPIHVLSLNGGGILLGNNVDPVRQNIFVEECSGTIELKGVNFIFTLSHFPCGKAGMLEMDLLDIIERTLEGKILLKEVLGGKINGVLPIISIDWRNDPEQTHGDEVLLYGTKVQHLASIQAIREQMKREQHGWTRGNPRPLQAEMFN